MGFQGSILVPTHLAWEPDPERGDMICGLLRELAGNIVKYASPSGGYTISVMQTGEGDYRVRAQRALAERSGGVVKRFAAVPRTRGS